MWRRHPSHRGRDVELATSTQEPRDATCQHPHRRCESDDFFVDETMRDNSSSLSSRTCAGGADVAQAGWRLGDVGGHRPLGRSAACTSSGSGGPAGEGTLPGIKNMKTSHILDQADVSEFTLAHSWMVPQLCANHPRPSRRRRHLFPLPPRPPFRPTLRPTSSSWCCLSE